MNDRIYYFSATGNCLSVARKIAKQLSAAEPISIASIIEENYRITGDRLGIVCPIYMHNIPHMVVRFLEKIAQAKYFYIIAAGAGDLGHCKKRIREHIRPLGLHLSALFSLTMPSNFTNYGCPEIKQQQEILAKADERIRASIVPAIQGEVKQYDRNQSGLFHSLVFPALLYKLGYPRIKLMDKSFYCTKNCNGCGICAQVCPSQNICMIDGKPQWNGGQCEQCYACLQWCPKTAIEHGKKTIGVSRYHHPETTIRDIINSSRMS